MQNIVTTVVVVSASNASYYYILDKVLWHLVIFSMFIICYIFLSCCVRDAIVINFVSFGTSLYAGIAVFSIIGFMAHEQHVPIEKVINSGGYLVKVVV